MNPAEVQAFKARQARIVELSMQAAECLKSGKSKAHFFDAYEDEDAALLTEAYELGLEVRERQLSAEFGTVADETEAIADDDPISRAAIGKPYALTDLGNAERMRFLFREKIRYDIGLGSFRVWDGKRWHADSQIMVNRFAAESARRIRREAAAIPADLDKSNTLARDIFTHGLRSESRDKLAAAVEVLKSLEGIAIQSSQFDSDIFLLNCANGIIDLRNGTLQPHNPAHLITKLCPVEYVADYTDERFENFLADATGGDNDFRNFLHKAVGYTLTGATSEESLFMVHGPEATCKSTFLEAVKAVMGDYARTIDTDLLAKKKDVRSGATPEIAALVGVRLAVGSEMENGRELADALVKNLTGGESITARHLYQGNFDFTPQFKIWLGVNHCPKTDVNDGAIWRRMKRVPFIHTIPAEKRDKTLKPYLRDPRRGGLAVFAWAVKGCLLWQQEGLHIPDAVRRSTAAYRQESDPLATFFEDCIFLHPQAWTLWQEIFDAYHQHAEQSGVPERFRFSAKRIQQALQNVGCTAERRHAGRGWLGISLKNANDLPLRDERDACDTILHNFSHEDQFKKSLPEASRSVTAPEPAPGWSPEEQAFFDKLEVVK